MGIFSDTNRRTSSASGWIKFAFLGVIILITLQGASCDQEPTESQCRPYIEKALKEKHLDIDEQAQGSTEVSTEQEENPPTDELTESTEDSTSDSKTDAESDENTLTTKEDIQSEEKEGDDADAKDSKGASAEDDNSGGDKSEEKEESEEEEGQSEEDSKQTSVEEQDEEEKSENKKSEEKEEDSEGEEDKSSQEGILKEQESSETDQKDDTEENKTEENGSVEADNESGEAKTKEETESEEAEEGASAEDDHETRGVKESVEDITKEEESNEAEDETKDGESLEVEDKTKEESASLEAEDKSPKQEESVEDKTKEKESGETTEDETKEDESIEAVDDVKKESSEETDEKTKEESEENVDSQPEDEASGEKQDEESAENNTKEQIRPIESDNSPETDTESTEKKSNSDSTEDTREQEGGSGEEEVSAENAASQESDENKKEAEKSEEDDTEENNASQTNDDSKEKDTNNESEETAENENTTKESTEVKTDDSVSAEKVDGALEETKSEVEGSEEEDKSQESTPEEDLIKEMVIPENLRPRDHITKILRLDEDSVGTESVLSKAIDSTLKTLKNIYDSAIKPLELLYKYRDLSNRHFGDPEIFSKPLILFMGPWSGGKSSTINYLLNNEFTHMSLRTGAEPSPAYFNILMYGKDEEILDGTQLAADWTFSGLQKFGQGLLDRLRGVKLPNRLLEKVNIVEIPGILEIRKQVQRLFPFNDACQWFIDRADIIFLVYDPAKLDVGPETEAILDQLKGREYQTRIILNKADQVKPEELMRVQGTLIWNISPLMSSTEPPVMYTTSLWSMPYEIGAPNRLLLAQERAFLRDLREAIDKRVENKIASARRFAVRVRNHAKMVDCYLTTYYNHKTFFGNRKKISDDIIENPQKYHIYEGLSTLTNISRYDLPDPDVYRDFFKINPLYDFTKLSDTCTYFRGCPINKLDVAIAYDLPELVGKYKKALEAAKEQFQKTNS